MKARFQIIEGGQTTLDTVLEVRNNYAAMHELLGMYGVQYNPERIQKRGDWLYFNTGQDTLYRTSTRFG